MPVWIVTNENDSGDGSLRDTLEDAATGDIVVFAETLSGETIRLDSVIIIAGKKLLIDADSLVSPVKLDGQQQHRIFVIASSASVELRSLTLQNGHALTGGAISNAGTLEIVDCTLENNVAETYGGAIDNSGHLTIRAQNRGVEFRGNSTQNAASDGGGAITNSGRIRIDGPSAAYPIVFESNMGGYNAGAILNDVSGVITLTGVYRGSESDTNIQNVANYSIRFTGNVSTVNNGGAIANRNIVTITNAAFSGNTANYGGAIFHYVTQPGGVMTLDGTVLMASNSSRTNGGAISFGGTVGGEGIITGAHFYGNIANATDAGTVGYGGAMTIGVASVVIT